MENKAIDVIMKIVWAVLTRNLLWMVFVAETLCEVDLRDECSLLRDLEKASHQTQEQF
jgi:hypothetical protein